jgi:hypothetical protein
MKATYRINALAAVSVALLAAVLNGCFAPPMANMQSARTMDAGEVRISAYAAPIKETENDEVIANEYGFILGFGASGRSEWQLRFDRFQFTEEDDGYNFTSFGPKIGAIKNRLAVMLPVGLFWADGIGFDTVQIHPGLIVTPVSTNYIELNTSGKMILPINQDLNKWGVVNAGLGLSSDLNKWALMPEVGFAWDLTGDNDMLVSYGIAAVIYLGEND